MKRLRPLLGLLAFLAAPAPACPKDKLMTASNDSSVIEFRRYTAKDGRLDDFSRRFETWFPEAFQQLGALALGQFLRPLAREVAARLAAAGVLRAEPSLLVLRPTPRSRLRWRAR